MVDVIGWGAFNLLFTQLKKNENEFAKNRNPSSGLLSQKEHFKELFMLKIIGCHKEKYLAKKMALALTSAFNRHFSTRADGHLEENQTTNKIYKYIYEIETHKLRTYRKLRFSMYLQVMKDAKAANNNKENLQQVFDTWSGLCERDMSEIEHKYISDSVEHFVTDSTARKKLKSHLKVNFISFKKSSKKRDYHLETLCIFSEFSCA